MTKSIKHGLLAVSIIPMVGIMLPAAAFFLVSMALLFVAAVLADLVLGVCDD